MQRILGAFSSSASSSSVAHLTAVSKKISFSKRMATVATAAAVTAVPPPTSQLLLPKFESKLLEYGEPPSSKEYHCYTYQQNSFARELSEVMIESCVKSSSQSADDSSPKKKKAKKKKKNSQSVESGFMFDVILSDSVLFAEGGGQPSDSGVIRTADGLTHSVLRVDRNKDGTILHKVKSPLESGLKVGTTCDVCLDWDKRWDQMTQHSAQHLISAVFRTRLQGLTDSWAMSTYPKPSSIDLVWKQQRPKKDASVDADADAVADDNDDDSPVPPLNEELLASMEREINEIIRMNLSVKTHLFHSLDELARFHIDHGLGPMKSISEDKTNNGPMRLVQIEGIEYNTCCGTHISGTSQLQCVKLLPQFTMILSKKPSSMTMSPDYESLEWRSTISFLAGHRVLMNMNRMLLTEMSLTRTLTCGSDEFISNVSKMQNEYKARTSEVRALSKRLIELESQSCISEMLARKSGESKKKSSSLLFVHRHLQSGSISMAQSIVNCVINSDDVCALQSEGYKLAVLCTMNENSIESMGKQGSFYFWMNDDEFVKSKRKDILSFIGGRGGGKPGTLQGNGTLLNQFYSLFQFIRNELSDSEESKIDA